MFCTLSRVSQFTLEQLFIGLHMITNSFFISGGIWSYFSGLFGSRERRILILGLDGAGKTTILYKLQVGEVVTTIPSMLFIYLIIINWYIYLGGGGCLNYLSIDTDGRLCIFHNSIIHCIFISTAIGFNVETVQYKNLKFQVWDLGGQTSIR